MAYPRKFREKIALQMQKQAEETAAFEAILREVSASTRPATSSTLTVHSSQLVRSLPNVNQMVNQTIDLQNALLGLEEYKKEKETGNEVQHRDRGGKIQKRPLSRDRLRASLPYECVSYLSPPSADNNWRRASSDSSLHSTVVSAQPFGQMIGASQLGSANVSTHFLVPGVRYSDSMTNVATQPFQVPFVSRSNGFDNTQCLVDNRGSLPDLSDFNIPAPLSAPPDNVEKTSRHSPRPLPFVFSPPAGGCAVANGSQPEDQSLLQRDGHGVPFSPLSPQPIITLSDASVNGNGGCEEILYSEDLDAIQDYLLSTSSPMVTLSPCFFRQLSGSSTPPNLLMNNFQSTAVPSKLAQENSSVRSLQELRSSYLENGMIGGRPSTTEAPAMDVARHQIMNPFRDSVQSQNMSEQPTLQQWNHLQHELRQLQQQKPRLQDATPQQQWAQRPSERTQGDVIYKQQSGPSQPELYIHNQSANIVSQLNGDQRQPPSYNTVITSSAYSVSGVMVSVSNDDGLVSSSDDLLMTSSIGDVLLGDLNDLSFDIDLMSSNDPSTLGLDPLALDELQMLTDCAILSDPDIENSFRRDRNFNNYRLQ